MARTLHQVMTKRRAKLIKRATPGGQAVDFAIRHTVRPGGGRGGFLGDLWEGIKDVGGAILGGSGGFDTPSVGDIGAAVPAVAAGDFGGGCGLLPTQFLRDQCMRLAGSGNGNGSNLPATMDIPLQAEPECAPGQIRIGNTCVSPGDVFPGGDPFTQQAGGQAVQGGFGLPAFTPVREQRVHRRCPEGMVLGKDNLCYPRQVLPRRSKFRKWRPSRRPPISSSDWQALKRAERVKKKARSIAETAGGKVKGLPRK